MRTGLRISEVGRPGPRFLKGFAARMRRSDALEVLGAAGVLAFLRARTTIHPHRPAHASALVTTGLYRYSRNPMYLALLLVLAGWAVALANGLAFLLLPGFVLSLDRLQIRPEERILRAKFGAAYEAYARSVRRWL